jgi:hypothetical protein
MYTLGTIAELILPGKTFTTGVIILEAEPPEGCTLFYVPLRKAVKAEKYMVPGLFLHELSSKFCCSSQEITIPEERGHDLYFVIGNIPSTTKISEALLESCSST